MLIASALLPAMVLGSALRITQPRQAATSNISFTVTNFKAFMANPEIEGVLSNLSFHVIDSQPANHKEVDCVIPPTYFWLYAVTALFEYCPSQGPERPLGFSFMFQDGLVAVRRGWIGSDNKTYTASASVNPYWTEGVNKTTSANGTWVFRTEPWVLPATSVQVG